MVMVLLTVGAGLVDVTTVDFVSPLCPVVATSNSLNRSDAAQMGGSSDTQLDQIRFEENEQISLFQFNKISSLAQSVSSRLRNRPVCDRMLHVIQFVSMLVMLIVGVVICLPFFLKRAQLKEMRRVK